MRIRELINRLEEIEQCSEGKTLKMVTTLIDDIIEHDIKMEKIMKRFSDDMEDDLIKHLNFLHSLSYNLLPNSLIFDSV